MKYETQKFVSNFALLWGIPPSTAKRLRHKITRLIIPKS